MPIIFGTYNISNGRNGGLEAALRGMSQANMDLGILQETKITNGVYTRGSAGYSFPRRTHRANTVEALQSFTASTAKCGAGW